MSYFNEELVDKLINAGFPYDKYRLECGHCGEPIYYIGKVLPTIPQLIEECGNYVTLTDVGPNWRAWKGEADCSGSTPDEALAKLYIQLNKKHERK